MALLARTDGTLLDTPGPIRALLGRIGVRLEDWPIPDDTVLGQLLGTSTLTPSQNQKVLESFHDRFDALKKSSGYQSQDLIVLSADLPGIDAMLDRFISCHTHDDEEIRYIIDGEGIFGFVLPDGDQVELTMSAGEYINVPAGAEHWFRLTPEKRIKAIRYFTSREGWAPNYTGRPVHIFAGRTPPAPLQI